MLEYKEIKISELKLNPKNPRLNDAAAEKLVVGIGAYGFINPVVVNKRDNTVLAGHTRIKALKKLGTDTVPVLFVDMDEKTARGFAIWDNKSGEFSEWDMDLVKLELEALDLADFDLDLTGWDLDLDFDKEPGVGDNAPPVLLKDRFVVPPFSILDTRQGYWQERKKAWKELIKDKAESREMALAFHQTVKRGNEVVVLDGDGVSLLDPVLAEISIKWFGVEGGNAFDCFAGDSVFGYVASHEGQIFTGIELRQEQVVLNNDRISDFPQCKYICDDGQNISKYVKKESQDLLFSCPPYFDLEIYSDSANDASNQVSYEEFLDILKNAFTDAVGCLKNNRFAFIVVGDVRNKKTGGYYGFPDDVKKIFKDAGMLIYNEMILVEMLGTAMLRVGRYMKSRKLAKTHQNVLVFYKGDTSKIKEIFPEIPREELEIESDDME